MHVDLERLSMFKFTIVLHLMFFTFWIEALMQAKTH